MMKLVWSREEMESIYACSDSARDGHQMDMMTTGSFENGLDAPPTTSC
jgi:hypothetical protein